MSWRVKREKDTSLKWKSLNILNHDDDKYDYNKDADNLEDNDAVG